MAGSIWVLRNGPDSWVVIAQGSSPLGRKPEDLQLRYMSNKCIKTLHTLGSFLGQWGTCSLQNLWLYSLLPSTVIKSLHLSHCMVVLSCLNHAFTRNCSPQWSGYTKSHLGRGRLNEENIPTRVVHGQACVAFSWWMTYVGGPSSLWVVPPLGRWFLVI